MHTDVHRYEQTELSGAIIGCAFTVLNALGAGFLEKVYENALAHERRKAGLAVTQQRGIIVTYDGKVVGEYFVDLLVEEILLVESKTVKNTRRSTSSPMRQLSQGNRPAALPAPQLRQATLGDQAHRKLTVI
jgi:GxxExxY protein